MKTLPIFVFIVWSGVTSLGAAQIYLVSGSQNTKVPEKFATELISVSESGAVSSEVEIVSKDAGTWFVEPIYEGRKLVVMSESPYSKLSVVDFDTAKVVKRCIQPPSPTGYGGGFLEWVANVPSVGPAFVQALGSDKGEDVIRRMSIDPSVSCESSFAIITAADARSVIFNGRAGIADIGANDLPSFRMDARGSIATLLSGQLIYPGYVIPENLRTGIEQPWFTLLINNPQMMVASITSRSPAGTYRVVAFRKTDGAWLKIPQVGGAWGIVRGFGSYVAMTETRARGSEYESAGRSLWRKGRSARGPDIDARLRNSDFIYPGTLYLFDTSGEHSFTIRTNQADSEVLLVENGTVYYRVGDSLYSVPIRANDLGDPQLIATDELIRDAHWAFIPR